MNTSHLSRLHLALWLVFLLLGLLLIAPSYAGFFDPEIQREYKKESVTIYWKEVDDLSICAMRTRQPLLGCAFWNGNTCTIYTHRNPSLDMLGHEMMHCFTGHWHVKNQEQE